MVASVFRMFQTRPSVSMQVVLHLPRNPLRQAAFGEAGLEVRLMREHVAVIIEDRVFLNLGMSGKPSLDLFACERPGRSGVLSMIPTTPFLRMVLFHVLERRHVEESTTSVPADCCRSASRCPSEAPAYPWPRRPSPQGTPLTLRTASPE